MNDTTDVLLGVIFGNVIFLEEKKAKSILILKLFKEPVKSFVGMFRKMKISLYDN